MHTDFTLVSLLLTSISTDVIWRRSWDIVDYEHIKHINVTVLSSNLSIEVFLVLLILTLTAQKMKFSVKVFFSKCDKIRRKLRTWSHLLKKSLMENFIFWAVSEQI